MKLAELLDPLLIGLVLLLAGLLLWNRACRGGEMKRPRVVAWVALGWISVASCPLVANGLLRWWQPPQADLSAALQGTLPAERALVVLSAGKRTEYPEVPAIEQLDGNTQNRLIGAARLYREHEFGVVVVTGTGVAFMTTLADFLTQLGVPRDRIVIEPEATDTRENALRTVPILQARHPARVVVVTSAIHMRRSRMLFRRAGLDVIPAPVDYEGGPTWKVLPSTRALARTTAIVHEMAGFLEP